MTDQVAAESVSVREALVVHLFGDLTGHNAAGVAESLITTATTLPTSARLVMDLRELATLTAAGARVLSDLAKAAEKRGIRCALVVDPASVVGRVLAATNQSANSAQFPDLERALATPDTVLADEALIEQFEALTRILLTETTTGGALRQIIDAVALVVPSADMVSVTLRTANGEFTTPIETSPLAVELDRVQYHSGRGPCVDAAHPAAPGYVASDDLRIERRWPEFASAAAANGYLAILSTELIPPMGFGQLSGALNVYSRQTGGFTAADRNSVLLLATHASLALAHAHTTEIADVNEAHLRQAIDTRDVIGQAKGILMTRQGIDADEAFTLLRRTSQHLNVKLVDLARTITDRHTDLDRR